MEIWGDYQNLMRKGGAFYFREIPPKKWTYKFPKKRLGLAYNSFFLEAFLVDLQKVHGFSSSVDAHSIFSGLNPL